MVITAILSININISIRTAIITSSLIALIRAKWITLIPPKTLQPKPYRT